MKTGRNRLAGQVAPISSIGIISAAPSVEEGHWRDVFRSPSTSGILRTALHGSSVRFPRLAASGLVVAGLFLLALRGLASGPETTSPPAAITVVMDDNYPPYAFRDAEGYLQGITVDQWRLWSNKTGIKAELHAMDWGEAQTRMRAGEFDVIDTLFKTTDRQAYLDFTPPYARIDQSIFFRREITGITDLPSLHGFPVASKTGGASTNLLLNSGVSTVQLFPSYQAIVTAARERKVNVFVMDQPAAFYLLNQQDIAGNFKMSAPINSGELHRAVHKGNTALLNTINQGFANLSKAELKAIEQKWLGLRLTDRSTLRRFAYVALAFAGLALLLGAWVWTLRRSVRQRTRELRESQTLLHGIIDHSPSVIFIKDLTGKHLLVNNRYLSVFDQPHQNVIGKTDADLLPHDVAARFRADDQDVITSGEPRLLEEMAPHPDGPHHYLTAKFPLRDASGRIFAVAGIATDITERRQAQEALRESEERWKFALEGAGDGVWDIDVPTRAVRFSKRWKEMLGYREDEIADRFESWAELVHPDDLPGALAAFDAYLQGPAREAYVHEHRLRGKDGQYHWILVRGMTVNRDPAGKPQRMVGTHTDITAHKHAEAALRQSESRLLQAFQASPVAIVIARLRDRRFIDVNAAFTRLLGWSHAEAVGQTSMDLQLIDEAGATEIREHLKAHGTVRDLELSIRARSGDARHVLVGMETVDLLGEAHVITSFADITGRKQAELHIRQLNRTLGMLSDVNQLIVREKSEAALLDAACQIAVDKGGFLLAWIGRCEANPGQLSIAAHAGASTDTLAVLQPLVGGAQPRCEFTRDALHLGAPAVCNDLAGDARTVEWRDEALTRGYRAMASLPIKSAGKIIGTFNLYSGEKDFFDDDELRLLDELAGDISFAIEVAAHEKQRRQAEEELRWRTAFFEAQVESAMDGIVVVDHHGKKVLQNRRLSELWKIPPEIAANPEIAVQIRFLTDRVKHPVEFAEKIAYLFAHPDEFSRDIIELKDGTVLDRTSFPVWDKQGNYYGRIWASRDITNQRLLEAQLRQSQKMEAIGQLAGGVAHDFNNILAAIMMQADLATYDTNLPETTRETLDDIKAATKRAANLTRQLLAFSSRQVLQTGQLNLNDIVTNLVKMLQRVLGEDVTLQLNLHPRPLFTRADAGMLDQVLLNLVINARDAMPNGGRLTIETGEKNVTPADIATQPDLTAGDYVMLKVTDTGCGMSPEVQARIFEPFFTTKEVGKGTGLGLATVFGIVKQHRGTISVQSVVSEGTTFTILLRAESVRASSPMAETPATEPRGGHESIILVEDDHGLLAITRKVLEQAGYKVLPASNGPEAVRRWGDPAIKADLLLTDIVMPGGLNGREVAAEFKKTRPGLKVLLTSGYSAEFAGNEVRLSSGENFIQKPSPPERLLETIRRLLDA